MSKFLRSGALLMALIAPIGAEAADNNTSPPTVVTPQLTPAPQTPAYPQPPIGSGSLPSVSPNGSMSEHRASSSVAPPVRK